MDESRREFIRKAGYTALGIGVGCAGAFPLLAAADKALAVEHVQVPSGTKQWGMVIDTQKCMNEKLVKW